MSTTPSPKALAPRPDLEWLRKRAKRALAELRRARPEARLADAQLAVAREHGFASWRALVAHVDAVRTPPTAALSDELVGPFLRLVGTGELDAVAAALRERPALINAVGPHPFWGGRPQALHVAIETNRFEMVSRLLRAGADVNGTNDQYSHWSPLMIALNNADRGRSRRALLRRGARIGLGEALIMGDDAHALRLLRRGRAALAAPVPNDGSWLALARTPAAIDRLLALGASLDKADRWGATPVEVISRMGKKGAPLLRHLAARGIAADAEAFARIGDKRSLARLFAADPALVHRPTVVKSAVDFGHRALVSWLLDRGADVNARSNATSRDTCLHSAAFNGDLDMVELLLSRGADRTLLDHEHQGTPSDFAAFAARMTSNPRCLEVVARLARP